MKITHITLLALFAFMLSSCAVATQNDLQAVNSRLNNQEKQIKTLNSQLGIGANTGGAVPGQAEMWAQFQTLRQDFNVVRGQLDDLTNRGAANEEVRQLRTQVANLEAAIRQMSSELAIDLPMLEGASGATAVRQQPARQPQTTPAQPASTDLAKSLYDSGTKAFSERRYSDAVRIFTDFINTYPKHNLISNAHFWQGESYYQMKNYSNAILAYQQVIEKYPGSNKLQSSMFKQGVSMHRRGQKDAAKVRLNELIRKYPKSTEAARAKQFLENNP